MLLLTIYDRQCLYMQQNSTRLGFRALCDFDHDCSVVNFCCGWVLCQELFRRPLACNQGLFESHQWPAVGAHPHQWSIQHSGHSNCESPSGPGSHQCHHHSAGVHNLGLDFKKIRHVYHYLKGDVFSIIFYLLKSINYNQMTRGMQQILCDSYFS